jgi:hypothetical protein
VLRYSVFCCIQYVPRESYTVSRVVKCLLDLVEESFLRTKGEPLYIFEYECLGAEFCNDANEFQHQTISGVGDCAVSDKREALTGRTSKNAVYGAIADPRCNSDLLCRKTFN